MKRKFKYGKSKIFKGARIRLCRYCGRKCWGKLCWRCHSDKKTPLSLRRTVKRYNKEVMRK